MYERLLESGDVTLEVVFLIIWTMLCLCICQLKNKVILTRFISWMILIVFYVIWKTTISLFNFEIFLENTILHIMNIKSLSKCEVIVYLCEIISIFFNRLSCSIDKIIQIWTTLEFMDPSFYIDLFNFFIGLFKEVAVLRDILIMYLFNKFYNYSFFPNVCDRFKKLEVFLNNVISLEARFFIKPRKYFI